MQHALEQNHSERAKFDAMDDPAKDAYRETVTALTGDLPAWAKVTPHVLDGNEDAKARYDAGNGAVKAGYRYACIDLTGALPAWARTVTTKKRSGNRSKPKVTEQSNTVTGTNSTVSVPNDPLAPIGACCTSVTECVDPVTGLPKEEIALDEAERMRALISARIQTSSAGNDPLEHLG
jgi:hypothetical protein